MLGARHFVDVALPIPLERLFTYEITEAETNFLKPGIRVAVPFGKNKIYTALVYKIHKNAPQHYEAKEIHQILDENPVVTEKQLKFWLWISKYYMCTLGEVLRAALPSAFLLESETIVKLNKEKEVSDSAMNDEEFVVYEALQYQSELKVDEIAKILDRKKALPILKNLIEEEIIHVHETVYEKYKPKYVRHVKLNPVYESEESLVALLDNLKRAPKQREILLKYFELNTTKKDRIKVSDIIKNSGGTSSQIKTLIHKNIFQEEYVQTDRIDLK